MSHQSLYSEDCLHQDQTSITTAKRAHNLFCICCLKTNVPFISLITCNHCDYLDSFSKPELKSGSQVVCSYCHVILKNIQLFKQQVQDSFNMLSNKAPNVQNLKPRHNLEIHKAVNIGIPYNFQAQSTLKEDQSQLIKSETLKSCNKKYNNIQTALDIIKSNNNMTFLAASALNADTLLNFTKTLLNIDILNTFKESNDEVPSKKIKLEPGKDIQLKSHERESKSNQVQLEINQILSDSNEIKSEIKEIQHDPNEFKRESIPMKPEQNQIQSDPKKLERDLNQLQTHTNKLQPDPNQLQPDPNELQQDPNQLQPDPNQLQPDPNQLQLDTNQLQPHLNHLQPDPNQLQPYPNQLQLDTNQLQPHLNHLQPDPNKLQPQSNQMFNRKLTVPKPHRDKIKMVRITDTELEQERTLLSQATEYLRCEYKCVTCIVGFQYQDNYNDHMKRKHSDDSGSILCEVCAQRVATDCDYKFHLLRHYKRYQCVKCEKRFQICDEGIYHYHKVHIEKRFRIKKLKRKLNCHCKH